MLFKYLPNNVVCASYSRYFFIKILGAKPTTSSSPASSCSHERSHVKSHERSHNNPSKTSLKSSSKEKVKSVQSQEKKEISKPEIVEVTSVASKLPKEEEINPVQYQTRLGLARVLVASNKDDASTEIEALYKEVIKMAPNIHSAYIELGEILAKTQPMEAVEVYTQFTSSVQNSYDDAYIYGEVVRLLMKQEQYQDSRLIANMIALGKIMGFSSLEKYVTILEKDYKNNKLLREVYAGINGKPVDDPDLKTFFKFKCW